MSVFFVADKDRNTANCNFTDEKSPVSAALP